MIMTWWREPFNRIVETQGLSAVVAIHDLNMGVRFADSFLFLKERRIHNVSTRENLTAEMIRQVYGVEVALKNIRGRTVVVPLQGWREMKRGHGPIGQKARFLN
jgi:ABC-type cobalamin/Fe3+-siderophores transport system ATPase subunit